jgi:hypothetical protein
LVNIFLTPDTREAAYTRNFVAIPVIHRRPQPKVNCGNLSYELRAWGRSFVTVGMMLEFVTDARWDELYAFFMKGTPPLIAQLMALNTVIFMLFMVRRMRGKHALRAEMASLVQSLLLFANMLAIFQDRIAKSLGWFL